MKYKNLDIEEKEQYEQDLLKKAEKNWVKEFGKSKATDIDKVRYMARSGRVQNQFIGIYTIFLKT